VMSVLGGHPFVFRNRGGAMHWLTIALEGTRSNRDGFGARLRAGRQTQYATSAGSYLSASDKRVHFGLGDSTKTDLEIWWPSGAHQVLRDVPADQFLRVREPEKP
jgi:enediyne biosynthesis protein E4